jgi:hypothetical protein
MYDDGICSITSHFFVFFETTTETDGNLKARHKNVTGLNQLTTF